MAFCRNCGKQIEDSADYCDECKAKANDNSASGDAFNSAKSVVNDILDTKDTSSEYSTEEINNNKVVCALAYIPILFWLPLVAGTKNSKYCRFHANQGLILLILNVVIGIVSIVIGFIPFIGILISWLLSLVEFGYFLFGLINTILGKSKELPFIGNIKIL